MISWNLFNRIELISFLEGVIFHIGVTSPRAYYIENIKKEIGFTSEDIKSEYYRMISQTSLDALFLYIQDFKEPQKSEFRKILLGLLSSDPIAPITKIGMNKIINLTNKL